MKIPSSHYLEFLMISSGGAGGGVAVETAVGAGVVLTYVFA